MKKLLNLFAGITLVATGASTVVACDNGTKSPSQVDQIVQKIDNKEITIPSGEDANINNDATKKAIEVALIKTYGLTEQQFHSISFEQGVDLVAGNYVNIKATINIKGETPKTINIRIRLATNFDQQAVAYKEKIGDNLSLDIPANGTSTKLDDHIDAIKTALQSQTNLEPADISKITSWSSDGALDLGTTRTVTADFTLSDASGDSKTYNFSFNVKRASTNQEKANAIAGKIIGKKIIIANSSDKTFNTQKANIKNQLKDLNSNLTDADLNSIALSEPSSTSGDFVDGQAKDVTATITVGTGNDAKTTTVSLMVTMKTTAQENAENLAKEIQTVVPNQTSPVYVSDQDVDPTYDPANDKTGALINRTLKTKTIGATYQVTPTNVNQISYKDVPDHATQKLQSGQSTEIYGKITYGTAANDYVAFHIWVFLANNDANRAKALADKMNVKSFNLGLVAEAKVGGTDTDIALKRIIQEDNSDPITGNTSSDKAVQLTDVDLSHIIIDPDQSLQGGTDTDITTKLSFGGTIYDTVTIQVKYNQLAQQYVNSVANAFNQMVAFSRNIVRVNDDLDFSNETGFVGTQASDNSITQRLNRGLIASKTEFRGKAGLLNYVSYTSEVLVKGLNTINVQFKLVTPIKKD